MHYCLYLPLLLLLSLVVNTVLITLGHDKKEGVVSSIIIDLLVVIGPTTNVIKDVICQNCMVFKSIMCCTIRNGSGNMHIKYKCIIYNCAKIIL